MSIHELLPVLQVAIGPVILISGIGMLLLTLSNRFGRAVDRSRVLGRELRESTQAQEERLAHQIEVLYRRAKVIRLAIIMAAVSLLLITALIIVLFIADLANLNGGFVIVALFVCCMTSLIVSIGAFILDIQLSLKALNHELGIRKDDLW
jgi:amino acid transporter